MTEKYIDVLETGGECDFSAHMRLRVQKMIAQLKKEGISKILQEYCRLAMLPQLSPESGEEDMLRLDEILALAEQDEMLQDLIGEIDHLLSLHMGLLDPETIEKYEKQQAWLSTNLLEDSSDTDAQAVSCPSEHVPINPPDPDFHRMLQLRLRELGLYDGPIDGVLGKRSRTAVGELQKSHAMQADGIPNPRTVSILLEKIGVSHDD